MNRFFVKQRGEDDGMGYGEAGIILLSLPVSRPRRKTAARNAARSINKICSYPNPRRRFRPLSRPAGINDRVVNPGIVGG